jgi:predicted dehydrogenase
VTPTPGNARGVGPGIGILGLGFMGGVHLEAWRTAAAAGHANRVVAVCDRDPARRRGELGASGNLGARAPAFDPKSVRTYAEPAELFADRDVEIVSICTHTSTHVELALAALAAGKHVLLEKPVALSSAQAARLARAGHAARSLCMPAMCMRFWPGWDWLAERVRAGTFGALSSITLQRLVDPPGWAREFYLDPEQSGGALFDLHVHDVDFLRWCCGDPQSVASSGSLAHVTTLYRYEAGPAHAAAEGGWHGAPGGIRMRYCAAFEQATCDFDFQREPRLLVRLGADWEPVELARTSGYDGEVRHLLAAVAGKVELGATLDEAVAVTRLLEAERASLSRAAPVTL